MAFDPSKNAAIKDEIDQAKSNDMLVPFVGAGFSINIKGYPSFFDFINNNIAKRLCIITNTSITNKIDLWNIFDKNPNEAIEYFIYTVGKNGYSSRDEIFENGKSVFHKEVEYEFDKYERLNVHDDPDEWRQHIDLVEKFSVIYTTNWDHAIEKACNYANIGYNKKYCSKGKIINKHGVCSSGINGREIIKFHGDFRNCDSLVASETDYFNRISSNTNPIDQEFKSMLKERSLLYLGYSISDVNIKYVINSTSDWRKNFSNNPYPQFLISVDDPDNWHDEKIKFMENWLGIKICFLHNGPATPTQKRDAVRQFMADLL